MIRSWLPFGMVGGALLLMGACAEPNYGDGDPVVVPLPPRDDAAASADARDSSRSDTSLPDAADAAPPLKRVFASSLMSNGNLGGLAGADLFCKNLAIAAGLPGTWVAWLSTNGGPQAAARMTGNGPWHLLSGELVAVTKVELLSGTLKHPIDHDEKGVALASSRVWAGTGANGPYLTNECDGWTTGNDGRVGVTSGADSTWTSFNVDDCGGMCRVYCFEN